MVYQANVIVPSDLDRDEYIRHCTSSMVVSVMGEFGSFKRDLQVSKNLFNEIVFPEEEGTFGSAVLYCEVYPYNTNVVIAVLPLRNDINTVSSDEFQVGFPNCNVSGSKNGENLSISAKNTVEINTENINEVCNDKKTDSNNISEKAVDKITEVENWNAEYQKIKMEIVESLTINGGNSEIVISPLLEFLDNFFVVYDAHTHPVVLVNTLPPVTPISPTYKSNKNRFTNKIINL